ncbi:metallophosphoesterase family protein [Roseomonas sp. CCTCC AB2023176]|uniref:metallophosphoesterase family protein n=1 Tax=Roseomonas sp. CCTCC AB2023176 TaxID=3342640 RepID=UPI0035D54F5D
MTFRVAQISDTHFSPRVPAFSANGGALQDWLRSTGPDLVVNTGDLSLNGADDVGDLRMARAFHDGLGLDWAAVPGNHDVGDDPATRQPANPERVARWRAEIGPDWFLRDVPGWRLIGLNSQVMAAGLPETTEQERWLTEALDGAGARSVALFLHKPLYEEHPDEAAATYWCVEPTARRRLLSILRAHPPALLASGHIHQWRDRGVVDGMRQVWGPSASFVVGDAWQRRVGEKLLGYVEHDFHRDGTFATRLVRVPGLMRHDVGEMPELYGPLPRLQPEVA